MKKNPGPIQGLRHPHRPPVQLYQVPGIGVVLQGGTIWLHLRRKEMAKSQGLTGCKGRATVQGASHLGKTLERYRQSSQWYR